MADPDAERSADNFPRFELARCTLFADPKKAAPAVLQHTTFVEIHDSQALADDRPLLDGTSARDWFTYFDSMLRTYAPATAKLTDAGAPSGLRILR